MKVTIWGSRGSIATPGPETAGYGGNTSCVEVRGDDGTLLVLDAGTGIRRLGATLGPMPRVDILLTHLHMDHLLGLGFFGPLHDARTEVPIWGLASPTLDLRTRLSRYLSPPLFPVHLRDLECKLLIHEVPCGPISLGDLTITADLICHPDPTVGYRIRSGTHTLAYLTDHGPALAFAKLARARHLVTFHHDPSGTDVDLDRALGEAVRAFGPAYQVTGGREGLVLELA